VTQTFDLGEFEKGDFQTPDNWNDIKNAGPADLLRDAFKKKPSMNEQQR